MGDNKIDNIGLACSSSNHGNVSMVHLTKGFVTHGDES